MNAEVKRPGEGPEAKFWKEYAAERRAALRMAEGLSRREKAVMLRALHCAFIDGVRNNRSGQRQFETAFLSTDRPAGDGVPRDYGDCGRAHRRMFRELDRPYWEHVRELRFWRALNRLEGHPELQRTLRAIRRHRVREKIFSALKIKAEVYDWRLFHLRKILRISI